MGTFEEKPVREQGPGREFGLSTVAGLMLVVGGTLLVIDNLNIFRVELAGIFWPLALLAAGGVYMGRCRRATGRVWAGAAMTAGLLLILGHFHLLHVNDDVIWSLALIALGVVLLISRTSLGEWGQRLRAERMGNQRFRAGVSIGASRTSREAIGSLQEYAVFSGVKRRIETPNFEGGELTTVCGGIEIDLRRAGICTADRTAVIEANAAFGGIEIKIPETWRLSMQGTAVFGAYEDKTFPPRPEPGVETPTLIIRGGTAFGAVVVRN